jgi:hypothetical protein
MGLAVAVALGAGCGDEKTGDAEKFCADLQAVAPAIMNPQLATQADVDAHVAIYESLAESVPLAIEEEWNVLLGAVRSANSVAPGDVEAAELARRDAFASEESGATVRAWVIANCGFDLAASGPISTVVAEPAATTTTSASVPATVPG